MPLPHPAGPHGRGLEQANHSLLGVPRRGLAAPQPQLGNDLSARLPSAFTLGLVDASVESPELLNSNLSGKISLCFETEDAIDSAPSPWSTRDGMTSSQGTLFIVVGCLFWLSLSASYASYFHLCLSLYFEFKHERNRDRLVYSVGASEPIRIVEIFPERRLPFLIYDRRNWYHIVPRYLREKSTSSTNLS